MSTNIMNLCKRKAHPAPDMVPAEDPATDDEGHTGRERQAGAASTSGSRKAAHGAGAASAPNVVSNAEEIAVKIGRNATIAPKTIEGASPSPKAGPSGKGAAREATLKELSRLKHKKETLNAQLKRKYMELPSINVARQHPRARRHVPPPPLRDGNVPRRLCATACAPAAIARRASPSPPTHLALASVLALPPMYLALALPL
ncbi:hypothetical protein HDZ31DRAFT_65499 [Schizophyllum fasciatum]